MTRRRLRRRRPPDDGRGSAYTLGATHRLVNLLAIICLPIPVAEGIQLRNEHGKVRSRMQGVAKAIQRGKRPESPDRSVKSTVLFAGCRHGIRTAISDVLRH